MKVLWCVIYVPRRNICSLISLTPHFVQLSKYCPWTNKRLFYSSSPIAVVGGNKMHHQFLSVNKGCDWDSEIRPGRHPRPWLADLCARLFCIVLERGAADVHLDFYVRSTSAHRGGCFCFYYSQHLVGLFLT